MADNDTIRNGQSESNSNRRLRIVATTKCSECGLLREWGISSNQVELGERETSQFELEFLVKQVQTFLEHTCSEDTV